MQCVAGIKRHHALHCERFLRKSPRHSVVCVQQARVACGRGGCGGGVSERSLVAVRARVAATGWRRRGCRCSASRSATAPRDATRATAAFNPSSTISLNGPGVLRRFSIIWLCKSSTQYLATPNPLCCLQTSRFFFIYELAFETRYLPIVYRRYVWGKLFWAPTAQALIEHVYLICLDAKRHTYKHNIISESSDHFSPQMFSLIYSNWTFNCIFKHRWAFKLNYERGWDRALPSAYIDSASSPLRVQSKSYRH